ncbi:MAG: phenylalanine--tRNA ligase subunit alpha [Deltaproteobacteria bacterium]|nr:phenylalanine--tRNA ligase subunit alpha [Deltaproteobacteria bacterium]
MSPADGGGSQGSVGANALIAELEAIKGDFRVELNDLTDEVAMRALQARYVGKSGRVTTVMKGLGKLSPDDRPLVGQAANTCRDAIETAIADQLTVLGNVALGADLQRQVDVTLPARGKSQGSLHPLTLVRREIEGIFAGIGFEVRTGPWVETEWHNFDALNTPADHPARDMQDTFFLEGGNILRSHTSPVQIRTMLAGSAPVRIIAPGNVFRRDDDATHTPMFPQVEGLNVGAGVGFADLKGVLEYFATRFFGKGVTIRLRPSFFPFTEPSAEMDASCFRCGGSDSTCRVCKGSGWLEIGGCGMVHPNVLASVGYKADGLTGYAFGMGLSRMAMLKYAVTDLRLFYDNDLRFLRQFQSA